MEEKQYGGSQGTDSVSHFETVESTNPSVGRTFLLAWRVRWYNFFKILQHFFSYYLWHPKFFLADVLLVLQYFFKSPYTLVREYDSQHADDPIGPYGETDFDVFDQIFTEFDISPKASVADLGSGRGRLAIFLKLVRYQERVIAYEKLPIFTKRAQRIQKMLAIKDLSFLQGNWLEANFDNIDVIYYYNLIPGELSAKKLAGLPKTTKIITIGSSLDEDLPGAFTIEKRIPVRFIWGTTEAFLQTPVG
jgi:hypothetical protein